jgi:hypothetical protein
LLLLHLRASCPLQTILLSDLVRCGSLYVESNGRLAHFEICCTQNTYYSLQRAPTPYPASSNIKRSVPNCHFYLQRAVVSDWMGSIAL